MPSKVLLFGDSHIAAIQKALAVRQQAGIFLPIQAHRLLKEKNNQRVGDTDFEDFLDKVRHLQPSDVVLSAIGGNNHAVFSTVQHPQPFDFADVDDDSAAETGCELIPYSSLASYFDETIRKGDAKWIQAIREATPARVVHVLPPPPKADNDFIQSYHESVFSKEGIVSRGVSSPQLRLRFWRLQARVLQRICGELGVEILPPPVGGLDDQGFLARQFYAKDATHANGAYGELVLQQIEEVFLTDTSVRSEASL